MKITSIERIENKIRISIDILPLEQTITYKIEDILSKEDLMEKLKKETEEILKTLTIVDRYDEKMIWINDMVGDTIA